MKVIYGKEVLYSAEPEFKVGDVVIYDGLAGDIRAEIVELDVDGYHVALKPLERQFFELEDGIATYADKTWTDLGSIKPLPKEGD